MRLIDSDRLLTDKMKSKYYHLQNGDIAIPIIDIEHAPTIEAISKDQYETRLKADLKAILTDLQLDVEGQKFDVHIDKDVWNDAISVCSELIQDKINELKGEIK